MSTRTAPRTASAWPVAMSFVRVGLVAVGAAVTMAALALAGQPAGLAAVSSLAAFYLLPVNAASLLLVRAVVHREGGTLRALIGFDRTRLGRDVLWGLLWIVVLFLPFAAVIMGTMLALYGAAAFDSFAAAFAPDPAELPAFGLAATVIFAIVAVFTFAPLNAPTEELVYRGYSQGGLEPRPVLAVLLPSVAFGLQHVLFASTLRGMLVYAVAFSVWGLGSALIYRRQRRLMPLIVAHFIVNLFTSLPAVVVPFLI